MQRTRIKICGLTRPDDAMAAVAAGTDAIGLVFYDPSPRAVSLAQAELIARVLPPFVTRVGLFVNPDPAWVQEVCEAVELDVLQFHGQEDAMFCRQFQRPYLKAIPVKNEADLVDVQQHYPDAQGLLLDAWHPQLAGGTGEAFDWALIPEALKSSIILAGGLTADNVAEAIRQVTPFAVDVSGGVELEKGIKCPERMLAFTTAVKEADELLSGLSQDFGVD